MFATAFGKGTAEDHFGGHGWPFSQMLSGYGWALQLCTGSFSRHLARRYCKNTDPMSVNEMSRYPNIPPAGFKMV